MEFTATPLFTLEQRKLIEARSGNPKSLAFPCEEVPKSIAHLRNAAPNTGHDLHLNGLPLLVDFVASKRLKVLLLAEYGKFIDVVSSASLMHRPDLSNVSVDETPATFRYGMSVVVNLRLIKKMCAELCTIRHIDDEIDELVVGLENTLIEHDIKIPEALKVDKLEGADFVSEQGDFDALYAKAGNQVGFLCLDLYGLNLSMYEQILRYNSGILIPNPDYDGLFRDDYAIGDKAFACSVLLTEAQAKIIVNQRKTHKLPDWQIICSELEKYIEE